MKIALLTTAFFHDCTEILHEIDGKKIRGTDKIIFGGSERYTIDLCHFLQEEGHDIIVYQPFAGIQKPFTKQYMGITFFMIPNNGGWEFNTCADLNWQFNEYSALSDIRIYFATFLAFPNAISPCITISHGIYWDNTQGVNTIQTLNEDQRKEFFRRQLYGFTATDICVSVDSNVRKVLQAMEPGSERKTHIIYNYVDCQKFYPGEKTWEGINVLFPRRLTVLRGSTEATKAFMNHPEYNFIMAGQAHDDAAAKSFFKAHENRKNVQFIQREMDDMPEVYRQADISLVPTISTEGLSLSLLESMASGLPVITTPVGGLGDAVIPGYNALIYDPNHDDLGEYIRALAEDPEMRCLMGNRNREIAQTCFDIEVWKRSWRNLLTQFGAVPENQYQIGFSEKGMEKINQQFDSPEYRRTLEANKDSYSDVSKGLPGKSPKPKLVAMILTHNDAGRYLERVIENTLLFCDEIAILDDHSSNEEFDSSCKIEEKYGERVRIHSSENNWNNESLLRMELLRYALMRNPDWLIAIDSDELYEADIMNEQLPYLMSQKDADWVAFRFFDMWDEEHYRDDDIWPAGTVYAPRMFRVNGLAEYRFKEQNRHCGSVPVIVLELPGINCPVRVQHFGWARSEERIRKNIERIEEDPDSKMFPREVYDSILDPNPTLVKWDKENPWQTSKVTIAYPPGMEWNVMQQRPHHLLKLAAAERNRVFFGDDSASGVYEALPYLTVVNGEAFEDIKEVDILYVTSPAQMERCKNIKYKKLVYDCCDWMDKSDFKLLCDADIVLFASKMLYDKIPSLIMHTGQTGTCSIEYKRFNDQKLIYLPNAGDYEHFSKTGEAGTILGEKMPEPIVVYIGCLHPAMVDTEIIKALVEKYKVFAIGQNKGFEFKHPNFYCMGHVAYKELPKLLSASSACIIPFRTDSDYLRYSAPIKVYEYLSAGRPVVATPIAELQPLANRGLIQIVPNKDLKGWVNAVGNAIQEYPNLKGQEWAKNQTWEDRWKILKKEILINE